MRAFCLFFTLLPPSLLPAELAHCLSPMIGGSELKASSFGRRPVAASWPGEEASRSQADNAPARAKYTGCTTFMLSFGSDGSVSDD